MTEIEFTSQQNIQEELTDSDRLRNISDMIKNDILRYDRQLDITEETE